MSVDQQHDRKSGIGVRDVIMFPDWHHPDAHELRGFGDHRQLHICTGVFGVYVSLSHSCHYFPGERPDRHQGWRWKPVEDGPNRIGSHQ